MSEEKELFPEKAPQEMSKKTRIIIFVIVIVVFAALFAIAKLFSSSGEEPGAHTTNNNISAQQTLESPKEEPVPQFEREYSENRNAGNYEEALEEEEPALKSVFKKRGRVQEMVRDLPEQRQNHSNTFTPSRAGSSPATKAEYTLPYSVRKRLSSEYQSMVSHFKKRNDWSMPESELEKYFQDNRLASVNPELRELYQGASELGSGFSYTLSSGSRIIATTNVAVSSDHPRDFTATIQRPQELKGQILYCRSGSNIRGRIPVNPLKIIVDEKKEFTITGQVEMEHPGLTGKVTNHWFKRMGPSLANAAIGGAFLAWSLNRSAGEDRVDTRDAITGPIVSSSVQGLQNEVSRLGGDFPNTVDVPAGTNFSVLISSPVTIKGL